MARLFPRGQETCAVHRGTAIRRPRGSPIILFMNMAKNHVVHHCMLRPSGTMARRSEDFSRLRETEVVSCRCSGGSASSRRRDCPMFSCHESMHKRNPGDLTFVRRRTTKWSARPSDPRGEFEVTPATPIGSKYSSGDAQLLKKSTSVLSRAQ